MNDATLGKLIEGAAQRDAIHVAIAPVIAGEVLRPGQHVGLNAAGEAILNTQYIGIVDPFLTDPYVMKGEKFWLCLYQKTVTGMRHHWSHPAFSETDFANANKESKLRAKAFLWKFCEEHCPYIGRSYCPHKTVDDAFRQLIRDWETGEFFVCQGTDTPDESVTNPVKVALAAYTGISNPDFRFSCTC